MLSYFHEVHRTMESSILDSFDPAVMHIFNPATAQTDDVVVFGDIRKFVMRVIVAKIDLFDHAFFF